MPRKSHAKAKKSRNLQLQKARSAKEKKKQSLETLQIDDPPSSASKRKLQFFADTHDSASSGAEYAIIDLNVLEDMFGAVCPVCHQCLKFSAGPSDCGLARRLTVSCTGCDYLQEKMSSPKTPKTHFFDVNRRAVLSFLLLGHGWNEMSQFCSHMGMKSIAESAYRQHLHDIYQSSADLNTHILDQAADKVRHLYGADKESVLDISVSYDGTWQKRGHTSHYGVGAVIEIDSGLVVDYQVMSSYCHECVVTGEKKKIVGATDYENWMEKHKPFCQKNHTGSSGAMEVEAAKVLWGRSLQRGLRYTTVVSDGDCKTYNDLVALNPYPDTPIVKEECVNHVAKRLGTALKNLVSSETKRGRTLGGRQLGRLTQAKIVCLQGYYKKAILSKNKTVEELRNRIFSSFLHVSSTDEKPQHELCPDGALSWCFFKRAIAQGKQPPTHKGKSSCYLAPEIAEFVRPVYQRLTEESLLKRCLKGKTQNANESLHSMIWRKCPKHLSASFRRVSIAARLAIAEFNMGSTGINLFLRSTLCEPSVVASSSGTQRDLKRAKKAEKRTSEDAKKRRQQITKAQIRSRSEQEAQEGNIYQAGGH